MNELNRHVTNANDVRNNVETTDAIACLTFDI